MFIEVIRIANVNNTKTGRAYCIGKMYIDNVYVCDTLEDLDRGLNSSMTSAEVQRRKVYGKTAVPVGSYCVTLGIQSATFVKKDYFRNYCKGFLPRLLDVPGYAGVLIHTGNDETHTEGCLLVGYNKEVGKVINSKSAFEKIYPMLNKAYKERDDITIKISRKYKV